MSFIHGSVELTRSYTSNESANAIIPIMPTAPALILLRRNLAEMHAATVTAKTASVIFLMPNTEKQTEKYPDRTKRNSKAQPYTLNPFGIKRTVGFAVFTPRNR